MSVSFVKEQEREWLQNAMWRYHVITNDALLQSKPNAKSPKEGQKGVKVLNYLQNRASHFKMAHVLNGSFKLSDYQIWSWISHKADHSLWCSLDSVGNIFVTDWNQRTAKSTASWNTDWMCNSALAITEAMHLLYIQTVNVLYSTAVSCTFCTLAVEASLGSLMIGFFS